ncbi:hypothetical protein HYC85_014577 [Camellia sinensis]|uniref:Histone deacetylase interacting domain-containing protein n=1 Tax=Camellia sinensis TaxID=4442 RepID=A0A7J7H6L3_CAMSI|nr:hypothetical protein HYC85_014577 [Camellia sinensis]
MSDCQRTSKKSHLSSNYSRPKTTTSTYGCHNWVSAKQASIEFLNKIRKTFQHDHDQTYKSFLKIMSSYGEKHSDIKQINQEVTALFKDVPGLFLEFTKFVTYSNEKNQTEREEQSWDMDWITKSSSSKRDHDPYEQKLFQREDYLFEIDMVLRRLQSANKNAQRLVNDYENENNCENSIIVEKYFTIHDMRCIEKLYDECGYEVIEILRRNPIVALNNAILARLKQKLEEWIEFSFDVGAKWGEPSSDEFKKWKREPRKDPDDVEYVTDDENKMIKRMMMSLL